MKENMMEENQKGHSFEEDLFGTIFMMVIDQSKLCLSMIVTQPTKQPIFRTLSSISWPSFISLSSICFISSYYTFHSTDLSCWCSYCHTCIASLDPIDSPMPSSAISVPIYCNPLNFSKCFNTARLLSMNRFTQFVIQVFSLAFNVPLPIDPFIHFLKHVSANSWTAGRCQFSLSV